MVLGKHVLFLANHPPLRRRCVQNPMRFLHCARRSEPVACVVWRNVHTSTGDRPADCRATFHLCILLREKFVGGFFSLNAVFPTKYPSCCYKPWICFLNHIIGFFRDILVVLSLDYTPTGYNCWDDCCLTVPTNDYVHCQIHLVTDFSGSCKFHGPEGTRFGLSSRFQPCCLVPHSHNRCHLKLYAVDSPTDHPAGVPSCQKVPYAVPVKAIVLVNLPTLNT
jgi:hypothetical protein